MTIFFPYIFFLRNFANWLLSLTRNSFTFEFFIISFAFQDANTVVLCPIYTAGEKIKLGFNYLKFANEIIKNSKVKLFLVNDNNQLAKFLKKNMYGKKIVVGMGAGSISGWMKKLPQLM